ncbi:MAG: 23S rRNA (pseudouridine(1915)-N(3))-methyltransferase RlmH [Saprospiraceae bacterium]
MKVHLWAMGAVSDGWVSEGEKIYVKRIERYLPFEYKCIQPGKSSKDKIKVLTAEANWLKDQLESIPSKIILLDEKGPQFTSEHFARRLEKWQQGTHKRLVFLIGSAYGFDDSVYALANETLGISSLTLPHQICRLVFLEQVYRACTILKGESYHHE